MKLTIFQPEIKVYMKELGSSYVKLYFLETIIFQAGLEYFQPDEIFHIIEFFFNLLYRAEIFPYNQPLNVENILVLKFDKDILKK